MRLTLVCLLLSAVASAQSVPDIASRTHGAARVVVGRVESVQPQFETNQYGDRLIVSHLTVRVLQTIKGPETPYVEVAVEGGTVGEVTLIVSDMPKLEDGDEAEFFLVPAGHGYRPYKRGFGIVKQERR
jgi:hypothetical protein